MKGNNASRFMLQGGVLALAAGLPFLPFAISRGNHALAWSLIGWALASALGLASGYFLNQRHGASGNAFMATFAACMLARLALYFAVSIGAASRGFEAVVAYVSGLAVGYVSQQAFEMFWFYRITRSS